MEIQNRAARWTSRWRIFWIPCGVILGITSLLKADWLIRNYGELRFADPVLGFVTMRVTGLLSIAMELVTIVLLWLLRSDRMRALALLWWSAAVLGYRYWFPESSGSFCPCLGNLPDLLGLDNTSAARAAIAILQAFVAGASLILILETLRIGGFRRCVRRGSAAIAPCILLGATLQPLPLMGDAPVWAVSGTVARSVSVPDRGALTTETGIFHALVSRSTLWFTVAIVENPHNRDPRTLWYEFRTDGTQSIAFGRFDTNVVYPDDFVYPAKVDGEWRRVTNATPRRLENTAHAVVTPTPWPHGYAAHATPLVLALGWDLVAPHFGSRTVPRLLDYEEAMRGEMRKVPAVYTVNTASPVPGLSSLTSRYRAGGPTNDVFRVEGTISVGNKVVPQYLEYRNHPDPAKVSDAGPSSQPNLIVTLHITNVEPSEMEIPDVLDFKDITMVDDRRFSLRRAEWIPALMYSSTNGSIPTMERVMSQPFYRSAVIQHQATARAARVRWVFFGALAIFPIVLVGRWVLTQIGATKSE